MVSSQILIPWANQVIYYQIAEPLSQQILMQPLLTGGQQAFYLRDNTSRPYISSSGIVSYKNSGGTIYIIGESSKGAYSTELHDFTPRPIKFDGYSTDQSPWFGIILPATDQPDHKRTQFTTQALK